MQITDQTSDRTISSCKLVNHEILAVIFILICFLGINIITASRSPSVWQDEVMFADPCANLLLNHHFSSTAWRQPANEIWAGNAPLHTYLLSSWVHFFGFTPTSVRSLNFAFISCAAAILWLSVLRFAWIKKPALRIICLFVLLCGYGTAFSYRSGRYDSLGILILSLTLLTCSLERVWIRSFLLFILGILIPWTGLQLIPYLAIISVITAFVLGKYIIPYFALVWGGILTGAGLLYAFFNSYGVWHSFVNSVRSLSGQSLGISDRVISIARQFPTILWKSDFSLIILQVPLLFFVILYTLHGKIRYKSFLVITFLLLILVPPGMCFAGKFPIYYSWMLLVPITIACISSIDDSQYEQFIPKPQNIKIFLISLVVLSGLVGLPARIAVTCAQWKERDYYPLESYVRENIRANDFVYSDYQCFYPARKIVEHVFFPIYLDMLTREEKTCMTVLLVSPKYADEVISKIGGKWQQISIYGSDSKRNSRLAAPYFIATYRREEPIESLNKQYKSYN